LSFRAVFDRESHAEFVVLFAETKPLRRNEQYYASLAALAQRLIRIAARAKDQRLKTKGPFIGTDGKNL
jgi:hypothetical protein